MLTEQQIEEMMARVRHLELKARRLVRESFSGEYLSSFRGQGLDFDDFREYQHGDEVRFIDWNVTARMNQPFVRKFREERELSVILAVDVSGSTVYGSESMSEREIAADFVFLAMGFVGPEKDSWLDKLGVELDERGNLKRNDVYMSNVPGVFVAGDMGRGQSLIVWAIAEGRACAAGVDTYLMGETTLPAPIPPSARPLV
mgnify:CR=1 FL=1